MSEQYEQIDRVEQVTTPEPPPRPRNRGRKFMRSVAGLTIVGVGIYFAYDTVEEMVTTDEAPAWMFPPAQLPEEIPIGAGPTMVCAADTEDCNRDTALTYTNGAAFKEVKAEDVKRAMHEATIAIEDRTFMEHDGVSGRGVVRAGAENASKIDIKNGVQTLWNTKSLSLGAFIAGRLQGASTIEMQTVSLRYMRQDPNNPAWEDKYMEARYARQLDKDMGCVPGDREAMEKCKEKILLLYYNTVDYGRGTKGAQEASYAYYGKPLIELNELQQARLAGKPKHPNSSSVAVSAEALKTHEGRQRATRSMLLDQQRTEAVINAKYVVGYYGTIGSEKAIRKRDKLIHELSSDFKYEDGKVLSYAERSRTPSRLLDVDIPYVPFVEKALGSTELADKLDARDATALAKSEAAKLLGHAPDPGTKIIMTINTKDQAAARDAVQNDPIIMKTKDVDTAFVAQDANGGVVAMIGSKHELDNANYAVGTMEVDGIPQGSGRDAGSTNKVYSLAYGYDNGWNPSTKLKISKKMTVEVDNGKDWIIKTGNGCNRLGRKAPCTMTPEEALAISSNMLPGLAANDFGYGKIGKKMRIVGVPYDNLDNPVPLLGPGANSPWTAATGYNSFANGGTAVTPHILEAVIEPDGTVHKPDIPTNGERAFSKEASRLTIQAMQAVISHNNAYRVINAPNGPKSFGGKTGTADSNTDYWFNGIACDTKRGSRAFSVWAGNPNGNIEVKAIKQSSYMGAGVARRYIEQAMNSGEQCDIRELVDAPR